MFLKKWNYNLLSNFLGALAFVFFDELFETDHSLEDLSKKNFFILIKLIDFFSNSLLLKNHLTYKIKRIFVKKYIQFNKK